MPAVRNHTSVRSHTGVGNDTPFSVSLEDGHDNSVICVEGDLDSSSAGQLREAFARALGRPGVIVDIRRVPFVDSAGLGALLGGIRRVREAGASPAVCCTRPSVRRLLAMTGFDRAVPITGTPAEAEEVIAARELARSDR